MIIENALGNRILGLRAEKEEIRKFLASHAEDPERLPGTELHEKCKRFEVALAQRIFAEKELMTVYDGLQSLWDLHKPEETIEDVKEEPDKEQAD